MATETTLWTWLKKARDFFGEVLHLRRVENAVSTGDPDTDGVLSGAAFTLELKVCARPARGSTRLRFHEVTIAQRDWHEARIAAGGASAFLIQVGEGHDARRYVVHGWLVRRLMEGVDENWLIANGRLAPKPQDAITLATQCTGAYP
jgi:hypothetical protein